MSNRQLKGAFSLDFNCFLHILVNKAKATNGISLSKEPEYDYLVKDRQNSGLKCLVYVYETHAGKKIEIRRDNPVTYSNGMKQRAHFNVALLDDTETEKEDTGQHHYYGSL